MVIGINTWKAFYRQNTNFSIPAKVITNYIANGTSATQEENDIKLDKALKSTEADYSEIAKFISIEKVYESGSLAFIDASFSPYLQKRIFDVIETFLSNKEKN